MITRRVDPHVTLTAVGQSAVLITTAKRVAVDNQFAIFLFVVLPSNPEDNIWAVPFIL